MKMDFRLFVSSLLLFMIIPTAFKQRNEKVQTVGEVKENGQFAVCNVSEVLKSREKTATVEEEDEDASQRSGDNYQVDWI